MSIRGAVLVAVLAASPSVHAKSGHFVPVDTLKYPYAPGTVYRLRLVPGEPLLLELPTGESARNLWFDSRWWSAETTPGSARIVLRALGTPDVVGRRGLIHIETEPSDLRISLKVQAVSDAEDVPAALQIYLEGSALADPIKRQIRQGVDAELVYARKQAEDKARQEFDRWRRQALANLRTNYEWGGDFRISRVADDGVQTFITLPGASDRAVIQFVDKAGKKEVVNYELENGMYVVQNKALRPGEKFRLILGNEQAWIALK